MFKCAQRCIAFVLLGVALQVHAQLGVTDKEIFVGQSAPFVGPAAALGNRVNTGIKAYFDYINGQGGVNGRKLTLVALDDGYEADRAAENTRKLIQADKVFALLGYVGTATTLAALPILTDARVPLIGPLSGAQSLREPANRYIFHVRASYFDEAEKIVEHLTTVGVNRIGVFYQNDSYGKSGLEGVERALKKRGLEVTGKGTVERNSVAVKQALQLLDSKPDAIVQICAYSSCAAFIREAMSLGYAGLFASLSQVGSQALHENLGKQASGIMIAQVVPFPFSGTAGIVREYQKRMNEIGFIDYDHASLEGFIAAKVLVEGLKRAGRTPTREGLIQALEAMNRLDFGGFEVSFSQANHAASKLVELTVIGANGKFTR